jgi:hypothetical protein
MHEVHVQVELADGSTATLGVGCARKARASGEITPLRQPPED